MVTVKRTLQALGDYFTQGQVGDIALLKFQLFGFRASPETTAQLQQFAGQFPEIDLDRLRQLPPGSLGYEYACHMDANGIHPLVISADLRDRARTNPFALRYTVSHDIFHVLLGFDTSYAGEMGVAAFMIGQDYSRMLNALAPVIKYLYPLIFFPQRQKMLANIRRGTALGHQAKMVLAFPFEQNWHRSIADIQAELGLIVATDDRRSEKVISLADSDGVTLAHRTY